MDCVETMKLDLDSSSSCVKASILSSAFQLALKLDNMTELEKLLNDSNINSMDETGMTLLHKSIIANRIDFVRTLISLGANLRLSTRDGWSALHLAAFLGFSDILVLLLNFWD
ncbi:unnamed protein product [Allacma fusca]|uniref:Uncharacterized protein n=1 Tax=Allacma fusca TaxID=39272 RepID=A0A8J2NW80_9HEXA|nr:unnamed protein product [Allacma fusca]